jgi:hypothetical protein
MWVLEKNIKNMDPTSKKVHHINVTTIFLSLFENQLKPMEFLCVQYLKNTAL